MKPKTKTHTIGVTYSPIFNKDEATKEFVSKFDTRTTDGGGNGTHTSLNILMHCMHNLRAIGSWSFDDVLMRAKQFEGYDAHELKNLFEHYTNFLESKDVVARVDGCYSNNPIFIWN